MVKTIGWAWTMGAFLVFVLVGGYLWLPGEYCEW